MSKFHPSWLKLPKPKNTNKPQQRIRQKVDPTKLELSKVPSQTHIQNLNTKQTENKGKNQRKKTKPIITKTKQHSKNSRLVTMLIWKPSPLFLMPWPLRSMNSGRRARRHCRRATGNSFEERRRSLDRGVEENQGVCSCFFFWGGKRFFPTHMKDLFVLRKRFFQGKTFFF